MKTRKTSSHSLSSKSTRIENSIKANIIPKQYNSTTVISDHPIVRPEFTSYTTLITPPVNCSK